MVSPEENRFTQDDIDMLWEWFFGNKWGLTHIAKELEERFPDRFPGLKNHPQHIAHIIDTESARRWREKHPHETNTDRSGITLF